MKSEHPSSSDFQLFLEDKIRELLSIDNDIKFSSSPISFGKTVFQIDILSENKKGAIIGETYARLGKLNPGQIKKIGTDFLKLITVEKLLKEKYKSERYKVEKKFLMVENPYLENFKEGESWLVKSAELFKIEIIPIKLPEEDRAKLLEIQKRQGALFKTNTQ